ncbi:MAG: carbonic anhydrase [Candidatus Fibromonas sp.]|jgi:carbonic anhydrase|nr:carbonic anhydrase [Candidatus Fibromonas sp.]
MISSNKTSVLKEVLAANQEYSRSFSEKSGSASHSPRFAVLTCMDARLDPAKFAGLAEGDAHVIRNAGGRASDDAIRSLIISYKLFGTKEFFVIHHTDCGMEKYTNEAIRNKLANSSEIKGPGSRVGEYIEWLAIADQKQALIDDVLRIRTHPLIPSSIPIYGYLYDLQTGKLIEVEGATEAGALRVNR